LDPSGSLARRRISRSLQLLRWHKPRLTFAGTFPDEAARFQVFQVPIERIAQFLIGWLRPVAKLWTEFAAQFAQCQASRRCLDCFEDQALGALHEVAAFGAELTDLFSAYHRPM